MHHEFEDHLLSAYLDDELSADERALVEQRLAVDPVSRELLEDLKRLRGLVATLPGWQGPDLRIDASRYTHAADAHSAGGGDDDSVGASSANGGLRSIGSTPGSEANGANEPDSTILDNKPSAPASIVAASQVRRSITRDFGKQRSMRWTAIATLAAGLCALALGLPYLLREIGPVAELAQRTSTADPSTAAHDIESVPAPEASAEDFQDLREQDRVAAKDAKRSPASSPRDAAADRGLGKGERPDLAGSAGKAMDSQVADSVEGIERALNESSAGARERTFNQTNQSELPNQQLRGGELAVRPPAAAAGQSNPSPDEATLAKESATSEADRQLRAASPASPSANSATQLEIAQATSGQAPSGQAQLGQNVARGGSADQPAANAVEMQVVEEPALYFAYSTSWAASEVDSAMPQVWNYIEPSTAVPFAAADDVQQQSNSRFAEKTQNTRSQRVQSEQPQSRAAQSSNMPAVGLATLPPDESVISLYQRLQRTSDLKELNRIPITNQMVEQSNSLQAQAASSQAFDVPLASEESRKQSEQAGAAAALDASKQKEGGVELKDQASRDEEKAASAGDLAADAQALRQQREYRFGQSLAEGKAFRQNLQPPQSSSGQAANAQAANAQAANAQAANAQAASGRGALEADLGASGGMNRGLVAPQSGTNQFDNRSQLGNAQQSNAQQSNAQQNNAQQNNALQNNAQLGNALQRSSPFGSSQLRNAAQPRNSLALFVNAAEARRILSSLDPQGGQSSASGSAQGGLDKALPPAWWTRSGSLMENRRQADDEKVILILNEPPTSEAVKQIP